MDGQINCVTYSGAVPNGRRIRNEIGKVAAFTSFLSYFSDSGDEPPS